MAWWNLKIMYGKSKFKWFLVDTRMIILATKIVFFQENGGKLQLLSADNKVTLDFSDKLAGIYFLKINNGNFGVNFEQISHIAQVFPLLTLNK